MAPRCAPTVHARAAASAAAGVVRSCACTTCADDPQSFLHLVTRRQVDAHYGPQRWAGPRALGVVVAKRGALNVCLYWERDVRDALAGSPSP